MESWPLILDNALSSTARGCHSRLVAHTSDAWKNRGQGRLDRFSAFSVYENPAHPIDLADCPLLSGLPHARCVQWRNWVQSEPEPLGPQRTTAVTLRRQLYFARNPGSFSDDGLKEDWVLSSNLGLGDYSVDDIASLVVDLEGPINPVMPYLTTLSSLGFYDIALEILETDRVVSLERAPRLFLAKAGILRALASVAGPDKYRDHLSLAQRFLAVLSGAGLPFLLFALGAVVHFGHAGDLEQTMGWSEIANDALSSINSTHPEEFTSSVLRSRFFRAVCFVPYLNGDTVGLLQKANLALCFAEDAASQAKTGLEIYLARENLFAALETYSKICSHCGNNEAALAAMERALVDVDGSDPETVINTAELRRSLGQRDKALDLLIPSIDNTVVYGPVLWHRMGILFRENEDFISALHCQLWSLALWPQGGAQCQQIRQILEDGCVSPSLANTVLPACSYA